MKRTRFAKTAVAASATLAAIVALASARAAVDPGGPHEQARTSDAAVESPTYVNAVATLTTAAEKERWYRMISALNSDFDQVCGDTFCEGGYTEIEPIFFRCSANKASGELRTCVWAFGETEWDLDAKTGAILVSKSKVAACTLPVTGTAAALVDAIHGLNDRLPGSDTSIFEDLQSCL